MERVYASAWEQFIKKLAGTCSCRTPLLKNYDRIDILARKTSHLRGRITITMISPEPEPATLKAAWLRI
ncbi:hypothetical protein GX48_03179 [Paracoccidioides brasiliensis]|nr:hypothetical protein GX48_03179 [Paracoccidioides brasiliensis]